MKDSYKIKGWTQLWRALARLAWRASISYGHGAPLEIAVLLYTNSRAGSLRSDVNWEDYHGIWAKKARDGSWYVLRTARHEGDKIDCPGWYMARDGNIEACLDCGLSEDDAAKKARAFFRTLPAKHEPHEECPGCCGYDVFDVAGSRVYRGPYAVCKDDACDVFPYDEDARVVAIAACEAAGYRIVDGEDAPSKGTK